MAEFRVKKSKPIVSEMTVPGDKSISHRAVLVAALSNGPCLIDGFLPSEDCLATVDALRALGVQIDEVDEVEVTARNKGEIAPLTLRVHGCRGQFTAPRKAIDCGNSGTTMRLLAGLLAGQPFSSRLIGDESLSMRPMSRVIDPLVKMGARIEAEGEKGRPPLVIRGGSNLENMHYVLPVASAQVKSAILFAGLSAKGKTTVTEPLTTRDHTERIFHHFLVKTATEDHDISIWGNQVPESRDFSVPGDISSAAFWVVAAVSQPGAHLTVRNVGLNKTRSGILQVLIRMGAHISEFIQEPVKGEAFGNLELRGGALKGTNISGDEIPNVIDELPILAVAGALAEGRTTIRNAQELRVKETDRIAAVANNLREMGVPVHEFYDGLEIEGGAPLVGARLGSYGDHRIAMAFAIAGLFAQGETVIEDVECVNTSYPGFWDDLTQIMSGKASKEGRTPVISSLAKPQEQEAGKESVEQDSSGGA
ncbi:MAG: 3-phosphoshikimate 1-carboxyvinyltransferase [Verrucomicrobiales bacterium]